MLQLAIMTLAEMHICISGNYDDWSVWERFLYSIINKYKTVKWYNLFVLMFDYFLAYELIATISSRFHIWQLSNKPSKAKQSCLKIEAMEDFSK